MAAHWSTSNDGVELGHVDGVLSVAMRSSVTINTGAALAVNKPHAIMFTRNSAVAPRHRVYLNGVQVATDVNTYVVPTGAKRQVGFSDSTAASWDGQIYLMAEWHRVLTPNEAAIFAADPWFLLRPRARMPLGQSLTTSGSSSVSVMGQRFGGFLPTYSMGGR
jgi:hypothetical protein